MNECLSSKYADWSMVKSMLLSLVTGIETGDPAPVALLSFMLRLRYYKTNVEAKRHLRHWDSKKYDASPRLKVEAAHVLPVIINSRGASGDLKDDLKVV
jgi:hypothetical protein